MSAATSGSFLTAFYPLELVSVPASLPDLVVSSADSLAPSSMITTKGPVVQRVQTWSSSTQGLSCLKGGTYFLNLDTLWQVAYNVEVTFTQP